MTRRGGRSSIVLHPAHRYIVVVGVSRLCYQNIVRVVGVLQAIVDVSFDDQVHSARNRRVSEVGPPSDQPRAVDLIAVLSLVGYVAVSVVIEIDQALLAQIVGSKDRPYLWRTSSIDEIGKPDVSIRLPAAQDLAVLDESVSYGRR